MNVGFIDVLIIITVLLIIIMLYIRILIIAEMNPRYELLDPLLDAKHRGRLVSTRGTNEVSVLRLRTPETSWWIHDQWIERYVVHIFLNFASVVVV